MCSVNKKTPICGLRPSSCEGSYDYLGADPIFSGKQFQQMLRVSPSVYEMIRTVTTDSAFYNETVDATGRASIDRDVKIIMALKVIGFGPSVNAFRDYLQMGESAARGCTYALVDALYNSEVLKNTYLRQMNRPKKNAVQIGLV